MKAAFLRGEPFVSAERFSMTQRAHFQPGDRVRIRYLRIPAVDAYDVQYLCKAKLDLVFSITFTIPKE